MKMALRKKERAIKKYNMLAYKKLVFEIYPSLREGNFIGIKFLKMKKKQLVNMNVIYLQTICLRKSMDN